MRMPTARACPDSLQVVNSLNKLDHGHEGKTVLSNQGSASRGELLLVSYKDVRDVLERSFGEIVISAQQQHEAS